MTPRSHHLATIPGAHPYARVSNVKVQCWSCGRFDRRDGAGPLYKPCTFCGSTDVHAVTFEQPAADVIPAV